MAKPKMVIIGAGVAGLATGLRAAELGADVTVLERRHVAAGSSSLSAGIFNVTTTDPWSIELRIRAVERLGLYERENDLPLHRIGYIRLARTGEHMDAFAHTIEFQRSLGVTSNRLITAQELRELVPHMRTDDLVGAIFDPECGHMDGALLCGVLAERGRAIGMKLRTSSPVVGADERAGGGYVLTTSDDRFEADLVVNAAGAWAEDVGAMINAPLPLINQVHEVIKMRLPDRVTYTMPMVQTYIPGEEEAVYFRQEGPGRMIGGLHTYAALEHLGKEAPEGYRKSIPSESVEAVAKLVSARLDLDDLGFAEGWTGLYPVSADGEFVLGPYESAPGIFAVGGLGGQGVTSSVSLGPAVAEWALLGEPKLLPDMARFRPERASLMNGKPQKP